MLTIRKATKSDALKILEYCKIIGGETDNLTFGKDGIPLKVEDEEKYLDSMYNSPTDLYLVATINDEIVGACCFSTYKKKRLCHRGEISISVKKDYWNQHIGSKLMEETILFATSLTSCEVISLEVRADNLKAISLYKKFGFEVIGTFKNFMKVNGKAIDCLIMELIIK